MLEAASNLEELNTIHDQAVQVRNSLLAALAGYPDTAEQLLAPVRGPKIPAVLKAPATLAEGFIRLHRGDPADALERFEAASQLNRDLPLLNYGRAIACARTGNYPGAAVASAKFADDFGDDLGIRFWQAFAHEEQGQFPQAIRFYCLALDDDSNSLLALNGLRRAAGFSPEFVRRIGEYRTPANAYAFLKRASQIDGIPFFDSQWPDRTEPAGFEVFRDRARIQRVENLYRDKQGMLAYQKIGPVEKTFDQLAGCFVRDKDDAGLSKLLRVHGDLFQNDPWLEFWQGELFTLKRDYPRADANYRSFSQNPAVSPADRYSANVLVVRCWLRADDTAKAKEAVNEIGPEWLPVGVRAAVLAQAGDVTGVEQMMAVREKAPGGVTPFYADEDFSRLIASDKLAEIRKNYPDPRKK
jgi:tetratricopeptide (TPR) repeat protein